MQTLRKNEDTYTKRETAKFQGFIFTQKKALGLWNWKYEQLKNWAQKKKKKKEDIYGTTNHHFGQIMYTL